MTPEQELKIRQMYSDNLIELMALQPELFDDKATIKCIDGANGPSDPTEPNCGGLAERCIGTTKGRF